MKKYHKRNQKAVEYLHVLSDEMQEKVEEYMVLEKWIEVNKATIKEKEKQLYAFEAKIEVLRSVINRTHMILQ